MKILLLGGAGFIGSHLTHALVRQGHEVTILDNRHRATGIELPPAATLITADVRGLGNDHEAIIGPEWDIVFTLASIVGVPNVEAAPWDTLHIGWSAMILALSLKTRKHVLASTSEVYGPNCPITDERASVVIPDLLHPRAAYAVSKVWAEAMLTTSGHDYTIVRFHNVYGPSMGMDHVIPRFCLQLRDPSSALIVDDPNAMRAFCYVSDAVNGIMRALSLARAIVNIGNPDEPVTMLRLMERLQDVAGDTRSITTGTQIGYPRARIPGVARLRETGWRPQIGLDDGLRLTWKAYR